MSQESERRTYWGVGQARWNSKKVSGLYNGPAYITVRPTQIQTVSYKYISFGNIFVLNISRLFLMNSKPAKQLVYKLTNW